MEIFHKPVWVLTTLLLMSIGMIACDDDNDAPAVQFRLKTQSITVPIQGTVVTIDYVLENGLRKQISVKNESDWITAFSFDVENKIMFSVLENATGKYREQVLEFAYPGAPEILTLKVMQAAFSPEIILSEQSIMMGGGSATGKIPYEIKHPVKGIKPETKCAANWVKQFEVSDKEISFVVTDNNEAVARETEVEVSYEGAKDNAVFTISQMALNRNVIIEANGVKFEMNFIEGGKFLMGATPEQKKLAYNNEFPVHEVTLSNFYMGKYEVTQELWKAVMGNNPSKNPASPQHPVEYVSWLEIQDFLTKLNAITGQTFVLPTEAQWEYAARGGQKNKSCVYAGSDLIEDVAWYIGNTLDEEAGCPSSRPVGQKQPNELGLYDMSGNVWEWCSDSKIPYTEDPQTDPSAPFDGSFCNLRGGSFYTEAWYCRVSVRYDYPVEEHFNDFGFRLVMVRL